MDVAALQTVSNANASAYSDMFGSQDDLVGTMGGTGNMMQDATGAMHGASRGITRLSSGMQDLGLISDSQAQDLMMLNAIIGIGYGAMLIYKVVQGLVESEVALKIVMSVVETAEALTIPVYGEVIVAAAIAGVALMYAGLSVYSYDQKFSAGDMSSGTGRRQTASQLGGI